MLDLEGDTLKQMVSVVPSHEVPFDLGSPRTRPQSPAEAVLLPEEITSKDTPQEQEGKERRDDLETLPGNNHCCLQDRNSSICDLRVETLSRYGKAFILMLNIPQKRHDKVHSRRAGGYSIIQNKNPEKTHKRS